VTTGREASATGVKRLSATDILAQEDRQFEDVFVPEWNGIVRMRSMTGRERDALEASAIQGRGRDRQANLRNFRARTVAACAIGDDNKLLFDRTQVEALGNKNAAAINRLFDVAQKLSGISREDVDELTIDLGNDQSGESGSS